MNESEALPPNINRIMGDATIASGEPVLDQIGRTLYRVDPSSDPQRAPSVTPFEVSFVGWHSGMGAVFCPRVGSGSYPVKRCHSTRESATDEVLRWHTEHIARIARESGAAHTLATQIKPA